MTQLINLNELGIAKRSEEQEKALSELTQATDFLPALRVYGSSATIVKQNKFPIGHFGLYFTKEKILDLGEQIDVLVIDYRPRASIVISEEAPVSFYKPESAEFIDIKNKGQAGEQGYVFGLEYLLWFPSVKHFGLFLMGNSTLRRESDNVKSAVGKALTLKVKFIPSKKYGGWHGAEALECNVPFDIPPVEDIKAVHANKFANPVDSEVSLASGSTSDRVR